MDNEETITFEINTNLGYAAMLFSVCLSEYDFKKFVCEYYKQICAPCVTLYEFNNDPTDLIFAVCHNIGDGGSDSKRLIEQDPELILTNLPINKIIEYLNIMGDEFKKGFCVGAWLNVKIVEDN